ncbi:hypothetical protein NG798_09925 [Ancylothrix sp. C2]|uniref:hypothetical protein n=1 Tax=Ancylothrix sp. D3o TaxID=2953691 RepID=UPI0021BAD456|nr:hypothetical protein [Ancylothrix sp. D3o]MCT7950103.1 hypothetical protein [Ancylothrix sp. D3o]
MGRIEEIINQAITIGQLSPEAEQQLKQHLATQTDPQDLFAFMLLQHAFISGRVRQTRQQLQPNQTKKPPNNTSE